MALVESVIAHASDFLWTYILSVMLITTGVLYTVRLKFFQFTLFGHILKNTIGQVFKRNNEKGTITPFQAFTSALASTAGATNIVGVPVAIALGGPGALFWMWAVALIGMATKYGEIVLGMKYREKNENGVWVGGPQYYIKKALGWNVVATLFAVFLMVEIIPSVMVQSNSITTQLQGAFNWPVELTGLLIAVAIGIIVFGGIQRIAKVTDKLVPFMVISYLLLALIVIAVNIDQVPHVFKLIFTHAFAPISAAGGFAGAGIAQAIRWGVARGLYSNEAGMGTGTIAHAAAQTDHPSKQAFWGVFSVFVDTILICTVSGLLVLVTGAWQDVEAAQASSMINIAFANLYGETFGGAFVAVFLLFFVVTTIGILIFFGEKQAEYLVGLKTAKGMRFVYLAAIYIGAIGGLQLVWQFLDLILAFVVICNVIPLMFLNREVKEITEDYKYRIYKGNGGEPTIELFAESETTKK
ncbi:sodium:alanine symporter family protein [Virgibacillus sp. C22-A2]|uniref:Sodium:alanine symporter family protein n=1 Tax=Virgibacillus tibetensis TaxID=3042313 RepID=A0ABU6KFH4_9BACI|nr:sodium:alanine symporter family protein [Virgibacillus sp. C22-A2]